MISALARSAPGKRLLLATTPSWEEPAVRQRLEEIAELTQWRLRHGRLPLSGVEEVSPALTRIRESGGGCDAQILRPILAAARAAQRVVRALEKTGAPHLSRRREALPQFRELLDFAERLFEADGSLSDDASPELARLRAKLRRRRAEVSGSLARLLEARREFFGDAVVVLRNDRYCLPVLAAARSRVPGIVHDRSGSGQTLFVEPLEVIEKNNELSLLAGEERREAARILSDFGREVLLRAPDLETAVEMLAELDALEAKLEFGEIARGRIPELATDGGWSIVSARHPLLDPLLAPLRRRVLSETRGVREVIPLDFDLSPRQRLLVISGPNAGGKTVVLKTAGLFSMLAQSGIPVPAGIGTRLPVFRAIRAEVGDSQQILEDRSTFSSSMETLAKILAESDCGTLALIDEMGSATDPEEGGALASAYLEEYLTRGGRAIVTTHLSTLKNFANSRSDALSAAMEFDEETGRPNYRLHPGLTGRSRALSVAREQGIPDSVLARAREILGESWRRQEARETQAEEALQKLREVEKELVSELERARRQEEKLSQERASLGHESKRQLAQWLERFEKARHEMARRFEEELSAIRRDSTRQAQVSAASLAGEIAAGAERQEGIEAARQELAPSGDLLPGARARVRGGRAEGRVLSLEGEMVWLDVGGKRMRVSRSDVEAVSASASPRPRVAASPRPRSSRPEPATALTREVNVIGQRLEEAIVQAEKKLDEALLEGAGRLRIIHGHGTGRLREGLREHFRGYPGVARLYAADAREGGNGATIVELE